MNKQRLTRFSRLRLSHLRRRTLAAALMVILVAAALPCRAEETAAETTTLTLEDALRIAGEHNRDLQLAAEYRKQVHGKYVEERASALPQLSFSGMAASSNDEAQAALSQGLTPARSDFEKVELELTQPLYTWGQLGAAVRAARVGLATADEQWRLSRQKMVRDVSTAFYDTLLAKQMLAIARQNLEQKLSHAEEARRKFSAGTATDYEVLAAGVAADNARPQVIQGENMVRLTLDKVRFLVGLDSQEFDVAGELSSPETTMPDFTEALETARINRPDLALLRQKIVISQELVKITKANDKPKLALAASTGWQQYEMMGQDFSGDNWSAALVLSWPVFDGLRTRGQTAQAKSDLASLHINEAQLLDGIALEVRNALSTAHEAKEIAAALSGTVDQAERLLTMAEHGHDLGVMTRLDVEDALLNLTAARGNLARARHDFLAALANLNWVTGK